MKHTLLIVAGATLLAAACQSAGNGEAASTEPDPRQGAEVSQICFTSQIRGWRENDSRSVIVEKGLREEFKLTLVGTCNPSDAFMSVGLISRVGGGSCLSQGDRLVTDARYNDGPCTIQRIHEWNKDAGKPAEAADPNEK